MTPDWMDLFTVRDSFGRPVAYPANLPPGTVVGGQVPYGAGVSVNQTSQYAVNQAAAELNELALLHNTLLVGNQLISTGTGDNMTSPNPTSTVKKPWLDAPDGAVPFDPQTKVALPAVGGTATVVTLTVPEGMDGVINAYSWNFTGGGFVQGDGTLKAQLLRDGVPIRNYENILVEKGTIAIPRPIAPLRIFSNQTISLVITHIGNVLLNGDVIASLVGWFYPSAS